MKILLVSSSSGSRGGGEIFLKYLARGLVQRGHKIVSWCAQHPRMNEFAAGQAELGQVVRSPYRNFYDYKTRILATCLNAATSRRLAGEWARLKPDVIHINKQNLEDGLDLLRAADMLPTPSLSTIHITQSAAFLGARIAWLRDWLARRCLCAYQGLYVAVQETRRKELSDFLRNGHATRTIFNGVPMLALHQRQAGRQSRRRELNVQDDQLLVLDVGRMEAQKRPMLFLELAGRLIRMFSFAGDTILDPFVGTGSTCEAAVETGRNSIGVEIDPVYLKMAKRKLAGCCSVRRMFGPLESELLVDYSSQA